jgi:SnoaL-like polyketide cyclase
MTSNAERAEALVRAVGAGVAGDSTVVADLYTDDVRGRTPSFTVCSAAELAVEIEDRGDAFSDIDLVISALDVADERACVEWVANMTHTGPLQLPGDQVVEPTGRRVTVHGVAVAEFEGDRISSFRQYWDEVELLDQLSSSPADAPANQGGQPWSSDPSGSRSQPV